MRDALYAEVYKAPYLWQGCNMETRLQTALGCRLRSCFVTAPFVRAGKLSWDVPKQSWDDREYQPRSHDLFDKDMGRQISKAIILMEIGLEMK
jgi:hypothetical protein